MNDLKDQLKTDLNLNPVPKILTEEPASSFFSQIKALIYGVILIALAFKLISSSEKEYIETYKIIHEKKNLSVVDININNINPLNENKVVYLTGNLTSDEKVSDETFGLNDISALGLKRYVEVYEEGFARIYKGRITHNKRWFNKHPNNPYESLLIIPSKINLGAFKVDKRFITKLESFNKLSANNVLYIGKDVLNPEIGDVKVTFTTIPIEVYSIIGVQIEDLIIPYNDEPLIDVGVVKKERMLENDNYNNLIKCWGFRLLSLAMVYIGIISFFNCIMRQSVGRLLFFILLISIIIEVIITFIWSKY